MEDHDYFLLRAAEERAAAERATSAEVKRVHLDLANRYLTMINFKATASAFQDRLSA